VNATLNIDGTQNIEVSKPIPCAKEPAEQLRIMEAYTVAHRESEGMDKSRREIRCLKTIFPALFAPIGEDDLLAGRLDYLPIGFGCVTSVGGVGHYCVFHKLRAFRELLDTEEEKARVDALYDYWQAHDLKTIYCREVLVEDIIGKFIDCSYPMMATARLSGMMLDYKKLMRLGVEGLKGYVREADEMRKEHWSNTFLESCHEGLELFQTVIDRQIELVREAHTPRLSRLGELALMEADLAHIRSAPPETFRQALQLFWLYALCAGVINYGRMDDVLGPYLQADLDGGRIDEEGAYRLLKSLWKMIENRRTTVNGRIIVGGKGREHPKEADTFARVCLRVCRDTRYVEPQFTLRFDKDTPADIMDAAYDCIGSGATYPTLYNDDVNVQAVGYAMRLDQKRAEQYVPFGCGEFVIQGKSVGTPNILLNLLTMLNITLHGGRDPMDGKRKCGPVDIPDCGAFDTFEALYGKYKELLDYYFELSAKAQARSYEIMNEQVSFLFTSILMDDCVGRGRALLDGGVEILGGTNETYGNINASDALWAIKKLVYMDRKYTLPQLCEAQMADFVGYEKIRKDLLAQDKYGNDKDGCDGLANDLYEYVAKGVRQAGFCRGLDYFLIVISNNQTNTDWGHGTFASLDGRKTGVFMNPANNPQGGAAKSGPTACLNSLSRFQARYHGGSVQNMRFTPRMFNRDRAKVRAMLDVYFGKGGCQLMVTIVDRGTLEDAQVHPENYPDLIVRVAGYSAVFVNLPRDVQDELLSRTLYDG
jgi:pyruvate-formate lyase